jgi:membrane-associated phospholipid phosphatase
MDFLELGCSCLETPYLKSFMDAAGLLGRGVTVPLIGAALWFYGYYTKNTKVKRLGWAVLAALLVSAFVVNILKLVLQLPRPTPRSGYGFPSGDSGTAFSFAAVIATAFPGLAPLVFSLATLAAISRLYFRAHYVLDVLGGAVIGILCGTCFARRMLHKQPARPVSWSARAAWVGIGVLTLATGAFFFRLESNIARHRVVNDSSVPSTSPATEIDFGTDSARPFLLNGWSPDETWRQPTLSINWVVGRDAALNVPLGSGRNYRVRFRAYPYRPTGFTCQWINIRVNDQLVQRVYLEQDWNMYEVSLAQRLVKAGVNRVEFHFAAADTLDWHGINPERRALSVAFDVMQFIPDQAR